MFKRMDSPKKKDSLIVSEGTLGHHGGGGKLVLSIDVYLVVILKLVFSQVLLQFKLWKQKTYGKRKPKKKRKEGYKMT
jgi:uncharacterized membrane protein YeiB